MRIKTKAIEKAADLQAHDRNANKGTADGRKMLAGSLAKFAFGRSVLVDRKGRLIAGNKTFEAAQAAGMEKVVTVRSRGDAIIVHQREDLDLDDPRALGLAIADNRVAEVDLNWDYAVIDSYADLGVDLQPFFPKDETPQEKAAKIKSLQERFLVPPFSVLDTMQGYWRDRKAAWLSLGIRSEIGRGENLIQYSEVCNAAGGYNAKKAHAFGDAAERQRSDKRMAEIKKSAGVYETHGSALQRGKGGLTGSSVFDPVLAELSYQWFCKRGGTILDPFAGGSVRGIVAAMQGYRYTGIDLRAEQIAANEKQAAKVLPRKIPPPKWIQGNSLYLLPARPATKYDFLFSCPPYHNLEIYSDDRQDLSNMTYEEFLHTYGEIIALAARQLKPNRFAVFVVGDFRDPKGFYKNFVSETIAAFQAAGMRLYNEIILVTAVASLAIRVGTHFPNFRKVGKRHQNVLCFFNGDPKAIPAELGTVELPAEDMLMEAAGEDLDGPKTETNGTKKAAGQSRKKTAK